MAFAILTYVIAVVYKVFAPAVYIVFAVVFYGIRSLYFTCIWPCILLYLLLLNRTLISVVEH